MTGADRSRLRFGPYKAPSYRLGSVVFCGGREGSEVSQDAGNLRVARFNLHLRNDPPVIAARD